MREWAVNMNTYLETSEGIHSLAACVLINNSYGDADAVIQALRALYDAGADLTSPAICSLQDAHPLETLAHIAV